MLLRARGVTVKARHRERSEAIHRATKRKHGLLRRYAPRNDESRRILDDGLGYHDLRFLRQADYFIGQMASATAACAGKIVTNLPPTYCSSTGSASLFWPISSNFTRFHGMMVCSPGISVATSASRILSPSVDLARLMASAITIRPMNWREV